MSLKLGAYTACLHDRPLAEALDILKENGLTSVEVNTGGFIPSPHCPVDLLLSSATAREEYLAAFADRGMELTGLNCNGNPLNPLPGVGPKHGDDLRRTIRLAGLLGVRHVVTMSGTPGSDPDAKYPSWVVNPWDGVYMDVLDYQWGVAVEFWTEIDALARENGVRVAIEMHPHNLVFSPGHPEAARRRDRRDQRRCGDGPFASDVAGHGHRRLDQVAGPAGVPRRREGREALPRRRHPRCAGHVVHPRPRRRAGQGAHRLRLLVQLLAREPGVEVRRRRCRP
ncbi:sugar phosphate isomerase/epimerase family protein [Streptomyces sp. NBC_00986]|uniref:sugar phosphate isomerase/epimerase family protein n=1 Tax=Streptomyces sp. NBC_00986 TaxID=2903702 RepID=UPI003866E358